MRRERGAFLVMMTLVVVVLIGVAALVLDIGRVMVLRAEMQNAVDAAALAAAVELDGDSGARERAMTAARQALAHDSRFARLSELLGDAQLPDAAFSFFCIIGARQDVDPDEVDMSVFCEGADLGEKLTHVMLAIRVRGRIDRGEDPKDAFRAEMAGVRDLLENE